MKKRICLLIMLLIVLVTSNVLAATTSTLKLELVEDKVCTILLNNSGKLTKKLVTINDTNKEATLQITVENTKKNETEILPSEIFLVLDNSLSMENEIDAGVTRKEAVVNAAKTLATKLLQAQPTTKIGVVSFSSLDFSKGETEGTIEDSKLCTVPTSSLDSILSAIDNIQYTGPRTNIEAGLTRAQQNFSKDDNNKALILLTDGVPNNAIGGPTLTYSGEVATKTKAKLKELNDSGIKMISVMTGVSDTAAPTDNLSGQALTYKQLAEEIFGTEEYPFYGKFYFIQDEEINSTITKDVYNNVLITKESILKNISVVDYFPKEIIDNYNYEIVESANIGKVSSTVDTLTNSITWNIQTLNSGEVASFKYKLKLKSNYNTAIINKVMPTNSKVDVNFIDVDNKETTVSSTDSPTIVLKQYVVETPEPQKTPEKIPQTGSNLESIVAISSVILFVSITLSFMYLRKNK